MWYSIKISMQHSNRLLVIHRVFLLWFIKVSYIQPILTYQSDILLDFSLLMCRLYNVSVWFYVLILFSIACSRFKDRKVWSKHNQKKELNKISVMLTREVRHQKTQETRTCIRQNKNRTKQKPTPPSCSKQNPRTYQRATPYSSRDTPCTRTLSTSFGWNKNRVQKPF